MIQELFPDAKTVGLLYCSAEPNSQYQVDVDPGLSGGAWATPAPQYAFTDTNDVASVTQTACDDSDVIYIPTDNTAASNTEAHRQRGAARQGARHRRRGGHLQAAAAWPPCPSATMTWATPPARWPYEILADERGYLHHADRVCASVHQEVQRRHLRRSWA